jgi:hypothetical protein
MCCSGADHMASGDLNRIESAFAEAALDSGLWSRALNIEVSEPLFSLSGA